MLGRSDLWTPPPVAPKLAEVAKRQAAQDARLEALSASRERLCLPVDTRPLADRVADLLTDRHGNPIAIDATQRRWFEFVERTHAAGRHAGVMAPRGSGKTTCLVVGVTADAIGRDPNARRQVVSVAAPTARKRVGAVKRIIERSAAFRARYPHVRPDPDDWAKNEIRVAGSIATDPTLVGYGVLSESVGTRSDGTAFDDVDGRKSLSAIVRESIRDTIESQIMPTLDVGALALAVATAWHEEDFAHTRLRDPAWAWLVDAVSDDLAWIEYVVIEGGKGADVDLGGERCQPTASGVARLSREFGCPVRRMPLYAHFDRDVLRRRRGDGEQPTRAFRRGYQQDAYTNEERWFPSFERCVHYGVSYERLPWRTWRFVAGVDLSSRKRPGNFVVTIGEAADGRKVVVDARYGAWTSYQTAQQIAEVDGRFHPQVVQIESVALQEAIIEWSVATRGAGMGERADWWSRLKGYETKGNVHTDEEQGIRALEIEFANDAWVFLVPHEKRTGCDCGMCELVRQFSQHPHGKQRDAIMATWFGREGFAEVVAPRGAVIPPKDERPERELLHEYRRGGRHGTDI